MIFYAPDQTQFMSMFGHGSWLMVARPISIRAQKGDNILQDNNMRQKQAAILEPIASDKVHVYYSTQNTACV